VSAALLASRIRRVPGLPRGVFFDAGHTTLGILLMLVIVVVVVILARRQR
jgi:hypothetical protein